MKFDLIACFKSRLAQVGTASTSKCISEVTFAAAGLYLARLELLNLSGRLIELLLATGAVGTRLTRHDFIVISAEFLSDQVGGAGLHQIRFIDQDWFSI